MTPDRSRRVSPRRVLIVGSDLAHRHELARALAHLPAQVRDVGTVREGVALLDREPPDLVVSDVDLPDRSGLDLLDALDARHAPAPILFLSAQLRDAGPAPRRVRGAVLDKAASVDAVRARSRALIGAPRAEAAPVCVSDYVRLAGLGTHAVEIEVVEGRERVGRVVSLGGEPWDAEDAVGCGVDAARRLAFLHPGQVRCRTLDRVPGERTLRGSWRDILLGGLGAPGAPGARLADGSGITAILDDDAPEFDLDLAIAEAAAAEARRTAELELDRLFDGDDLAAADPPLMQLLAAGTLPPRRR